MTEFKNFFIHLFYRFKRRFLGLSSSVSISFPKNSNFLEKEAKNTVCQYTNGHCNRSKKAGNGGIWEVSLQTWQAKRILSRKEREGKKKKGCKIQNSQGDFEEGKKSKAQRKDVWTEHKWDGGIFPSHPSVSKVSSRLPRRRCGEAALPPAPPARTAAHPRCGHTHGHAPPPVHTHTELGSTPAGIPACVALRGGVRPGLPPLPARASVVTLSSAGDAGTAAAPTRCRGQSPPTLPHGL